MEYNEAIIPNYDQWAQMFGNTSVVFTVFQDPNDGWISTWNEVNVRQQVRFGWGEYQPSRFDVETLYLNSLDYGDS